MVNNIIDDSITTFTWETYNMH